MVELSIVIPCYNNTSMLRPLVERIAAALADQAMRLEILLVNDASPDVEMWPLLVDLADEHATIRCFDLAANVGQTAATLFGLRQSRGGIVVTMDADLQHPPEEIPKLLAALDTDPAVECVMGAYYSKSHPRLRNTGSAFVACALRLLFHKPRNIQATSFRALRRPLVERMCRDERVLPLLGAMIFRDGARVANVTVRHDPSFDGQSNYSTWLLVRMLVRTLMGAATFTSGELAKAELRACRGPRTALILGVASPQLDAIRHLQKIGWSVVGCSYRTEGPGLAAVDHFEQVDIKDVSAVTALADRMGASLVYSVGSDIAIPVAARVSKTLNLRSPVSEETAGLLHDKLRLRRLLNSHHLGSVRYHMVRTAADVDAWNVFPAILKPSDSQGQRGVFRCENRDDVAAHVQESLTYSPSGRLILEEYLDGPEISAHVFLIDGQIQFTAISDRHVLAGHPGGIPIGHVFPSLVCVGENEFRVQQLIRRCLDKIDLQQGPVYFQIKLTLSGPRILEIAPRLDGCHLWRLIRMVCGADLLAATFALLQGRDPQPMLRSHSLGWPMQIRYRLAPPGVPFRRADFPEDPAAVFSEDSYHEGDRVRRVNSHRERVGYSIVPVSPAVRQGDASTFSAELAHGGEALRSSR